jgi:glutamate-ammonia-ligase adenylyltransferase
MTSRGGQLSNLARAGFAALSNADQGVDEFAAACDLDRDSIIRGFRYAADPDTALWRILSIVTAHPGIFENLSEDELQRLALLIGASPALGDFFRRVPHGLRELLATGGTIRPLAEVKAELCDAVTEGLYSATVDLDRGAAADVATDLDAVHGQEGWTALRIRYRELFAELMLFDLEQSLMRREAQTGTAADLFSQISDALSELAESAIEAALLVARSTLIHDGGNGLPVEEDKVRQTAVAVVAMGKCGAEELNVVSDVDVLFVAGHLSEGRSHSRSVEHAIETDDRSALTQDDVVRTATRIASECMRAIHDPAGEPPLWQLDANLRPEGKNGPLVRTLGSYMSYYEKWAETWEFQALLKARQIAGDQPLGEQLVTETREGVWQSRTRDDFVGTVHRMRERVTEHIDVDEVDYELKLGPGGLRDVEFSVQLLQLVHGDHDETLRLPGTIPALDALVEGGYVARSDGEALSQAYRETRILEHRLQLRDLRRTARMPRDQESLRILARASGFGKNAGELVARWEANKRTIRTLHQKIFYAPLVAAVAELPEASLALESSAARDRLRGLRFQDPDGAIRHLAALTAGTTRRANILRNLLPVLLEWLGEGTSPDEGLIAFRRLTEAGQYLPWFLRLLRDGTDAAERLTTILSSSRFASELLISQPEAIAWLDEETQLWPTNREVLRNEMFSAAQRRKTTKDAAAAIRAIHRREVLRIAMGRLVGVNSDQDVSEGLDSAHTSLLNALLASIRRLNPDLADIEIALIALGRYGGIEMGFSSDVDVIAVYRAAPGREEARKDAIRLIVELRSLVSDPRFTVDLDFDLRPEGKNGPLARTLDSYSAYYERWSLTWEAQALLRARPVVGERGLGDAFMKIADPVRYPQALSEEDVREIRKLKARIESERLPRGADPRRHLKLGPGGIADTEWLVQLIQMRHAHETQELQTTSTLGALRAAVDAGYLREKDCRKLIASWQLASALRSAEKLWSGKSTDMLPQRREDLEGIARILGYRPGKTTDLEERWFTVSRRARRVFEREFYGEVLGHRATAAEIRADSRSGWVNQRDLRR